jgi:hypothetical protein
LVLEFLSCNHRAIKIINPPAIREQPCKGISFGFFKIDKLRQRIHIENMINGWYPALVWFLIKAPAIGVPVKKAIEVTVPKAPSLPPSFFVGVICAVAAGMTEMNMPDVKL